MATIGNFISKLSSSFSFLATNQYISGVLILVLTVYAGTIATELPHVVANLFSNSFFRIFILGLIPLVKDYNPTIAILLAVAFVLSMGTLSNYRVFSMVNGMKSQVLTHMTEPHGSHGDMTDNRRYHPGYLSGMKADDPDGFGPGGYDGGAHASIGTPDSQL